MQSNSATASLTLLVCSGPIRCNSRSGNSRFQRREFALRFLHPVFAEQALARRQRLADARFGHGLGHRHQLCLGAGLKAAFRAGVDARQNGGEIFWNASCRSLVAQTSKSARSARLNRGHAAWS